MGGWFETAGVIVTALVGAFGGRALSRLRSPYWGWGYAVSLALIWLLIASSYISNKTFLPILVWLSTGRIRFVIIALSVTLGCMTLLSRLKRRVEKTVVFVIMLAIVFWASILPFLVPVLIKNDLVNLKTRFDDDNVCFQSTDYTCGPAAAVTALRRLGVTAHEGEIAVLSHTSPLIGTLPWCLYKAIRNNYSQQGLDCKLRHFDSIDQLRDTDVTLAIVRDAFLLDHCVAVLEVGDDTVTLADPILGRYIMSHSDFASVWRFYGIAINSISPQS